MEDERKAQDAFLTKRCEHLQPAVEPVAPQLFPTPVSPSPEEVNDITSHTHLPSAKWCEECVMARAQDAPHSMPKANTPERLRLFALDSFFPKREATVVPPRTNLQQTWLQLMRTRGASRRARCECGVSQRATKSILDRLVADVGETEASLSTLPKLWSKSRRKLMF